MPREPPLDRDVTKTVSFPETRSAVSDKDECMRRGFFRNYCLGGRQVSEVCILLGFYTGKKFFGYSFVCYLKLQQTIKYCSLQKYKSLHSLLNIKCDFFKTKPSIENNYIVLELLDVGQATSISLH